MMKFSQRANILMNEATEMALRYGHAQVTLYDLTRALAHTPLVKLAFTDKENNYDSFLTMLQNVAEEDMSLPPKVDAQVDKCWQSAGLSRKITVSDKVEEFFSFLEQKTLPTLPSPTKNPECRLYHVFVGLTFAANNAFNQVAKHALQQHPTFVDDVVSYLIRAEFEELGMKNAPSVAFNVTTLIGNTRVNANRPAEEKPAEKDIPAYLTDMVAEAKKDDKPFIGRVQEVEDLINCLNRKDKPNAMLVGEPGVGKTDICRGLARKVAADDITPTLQGVSIYRVDVAGMVAGSQYRGQFEERLKKTMDYLAEDPNRPIAFIDETHMVIGAGSAEGSMDASNILKPYLTSGKIRFIGATTATEFKKFVEKDTAFMRRWQKVNVNEPSEKDAIAILKGSKSAYENFHNVKIPVNVCEAAVKLSVKHMHDRFLPDKAIDILDQTCARVKVQQGKKILVDDITETVSRLCHIPKQTMEKSELDKVRNLDAKLSAQVFGQDEAISKVTEAIQMAKIGLNDETKPIGAFLFVGPSGVGKTEIAKQLAANMGINFMRFDMSEYMESHSAAKLIGAPAGYVGYEDGGLLVEQVRNNPHSVLLFDEIEKAHPSVYDVFLQMLDNGMVKDNRGRVADFRNTVIIMTSNAGNTSTTPKVGFGQTNGASRTTSIEALKKIMRPEMLGRLSEENIVQFNKLNDEVSRKVAKKELKLLTARMKAKGYTMTYSDETINQLVALGISDTYGAREMQKTIETHIKRLVTRKILNGSMPTRGVVVYKDNKFDIEEAQVIDIPEVMTVVEANS